MVPEGGIGAVRLPLAHAQHPASELLQLRIERATGDAELGARLENAQPGNSRIPSVARLLYSDRPVQ